MPLWSRFFGGKQAKEPASSPSEDEQGMSDLVRPMWTPSDAGHEGGILDRMAGSIARLTR